MLRNSFTAGKAWGGVCVFNHYTTHCFQSEGTVGKQKNIDAHLSTRKDVPYI